MSASKHCGIVGRDQLAILIFASWILASLINAATSLLVESPGRPLTVISLATRPSAHVNSTSVAVYPAICTLCWTSSARGVPGASAGIGTSSLRWCLKYFLAAGVYQLLRLVLYTLTLHHRPSNGSCAEVAGYPATYPAMYSRCSSAPSGPDRSFAVKVAGCVAGPFWAYPAPTSAGLRTSVAGSRRFALEDLGGAPRSARTLQPTARDIKPQATTVLTKIRIKARSATKPSDLTCHPKSTCPLGEPSVMARVPIRQATRAVAPRRLPARTGRVDPHRQSTGAPDIPAAGQGRLPPALVSTCHRRLDTCCGR
ncbi:MAG: hypothetical protein QOG33_420 [Gaiellales bacterium]|nr:hypothetical protein [Gaiellales bacterium]